MTSIPVNENRSQRYTLTILSAGIIFFALHFIFSWHWYQERMLQEDAPFYIVKLVQQQKLVCEHFRFSSYIVQSIPYFVMKSGASLEMITRSYSVAFDIYYFCLFLFAVFILKNNSGALMLLLFMCLALGRDYFLPVGEYEHAIMTSAVLFGIHFPPGKWMRMLIMVGLIALIAINFHPVSLFALLFIAGYVFLGNRKEERKPWIYTACMVLVIFLLRLWLVPPDDYENNKMKSWSEVAGFIFHPGSLKSVPAVFHYFLGNYPQLIFLLVFSPLLLVFTKQYIRTLFLLASVYILAVVFGTIRGADETSVWFGEYFILLGIPLLAPVTEAAFTFKNKYVLVTVSALSILIFLHQLPFSYSYFSKRMNYVERILKNGKKFPERRYIIETGNFPHRLLSNTWALPFQTLVRSSIESPDSAMSCIAADGINVYDTLLKMPDYFLGPEWGIDMFDYADNRLRKNYFNLPEKGYRKLTFLQGDTLVSDTLLNKSSVEIEPQENILYATEDSILFTSLKIINTTGQRIPAIPDGSYPTLLSYHIMDDKGNVVSWDNIRTPLEADVSGAVYTGLDIYTKGLKKGRYEIRTDLTTEGKRWWGIDATIKLVVR